MKKLTELNLAKGVGNFLANYYMDLVYIKNFMANIESKRPDNDYIISDNIGSFVNFLKAYGIKRGLPKKNDIAHIIRLFTACRNFIFGHKKRGEITVIKRNPCVDVDNLANNLKNMKISRTSTKNNHLKLTSLCSKVLFLYDPIYFPYDENVRESIECPDNTNYKVFYDKLKVYLSIETEDTLIKKLDSIKNFTDAIEDKFKNIPNFQFDNIDLIRKNRFIDKFLWSRNDE